MSQLVQHPAIVSIVDDDAAVRAATKRLVRLHGFDARTYASAEEFLASPHVGDTACLIADMRMPGMSGTDLQNLLIARGHRIPVIFMSAFREEGSVVKAKACGAAAFLTKPFDGQTLINSLCEALKRRGPPFADQTAPSTN
jgi:FixJ family two-component response regulator